MIPRKAVREFMSPSPITISADARVMEAAQVLLRHAVSGLPVVDDEGHLLGIVTEQDCLRAAHQDAYHAEYRQRVAAVMSREVVTVGPDVDVAAAIEVFLSHPFRRLPVVGGGKLLGVLSRRDCLRALVGATAADGGAR